MTQNPELKKGSDGDQIVCCEFSFFIFLPIFLAHRVGYSRGPPQYANVR